MNGQQKKEPTQKTSILEFLETQRELSKPFKELGIKYDLAIMKLKQLKRLTNNESIKWKI